MKSLRWLAVAGGCVALICGAAIALHFVETRANQEKLAEGARTSHVRAEQGDAKAQSELARMYYHGKGVPQDYGEAARWYGKAAEQGDAQAQYGFGYMYSHGQGLPQNYEEALRWYRKAAEQGNPKAQAGLGFLYYQGQGVPQDDAEAARRYREGADQGDAVAQADLGFMYYQGKGVSKDYAEAARWYRKAADQGDPRAQSQIGFMYYQGTGVAQDYAEAARWYRKAADQGEEHARRALSSMNIAITTRSKVTLSLLLLGSISLLIHSRVSFRNRQKQTATLAALLIPLQLGLYVYGNTHFGVLQSLSAVNAFYFGKSLLSGISVAMLSSLVWPRGAIVVLRTCGILFIGFNVYAIAHNDLRHLAYSTNGFLIGVAIAMAIFFGLAGGKTKRGQEGHNDIASGSGTESLGI